MLFSRESFIEWTRKSYPCSPCSTYSLAMDYPHQPSYHQLFDHGFIADRACVWGGPELEGCEIAIVSRTYIPDASIDNPPKGLRCVRLYFPTTSPGTIIATVINKATPAANVFLRLCCYLPVEMFAFCLPADLIGDWKIEISVPGVNFSQLVVPRLRRIRYIAGGSKENRLIESIYGEQPDWYPKT